MALGDLFKTMKKPHSVLGELDRYLLKVQGEEFLTNPEDHVPREAGVWHPSEISTTECIRALVYRWLKTPKSDDRGIRPQIKRLFDVGHSFGDQIQRYFWDMGILLGKWKCIECTHKWLDIDNPSPRKCPNCGTRLWFGHNLKYLETPIRIDRGNKPPVAGHADLFFLDSKSDSKKRVGEIKTIKSAERGWTEEMMKDRDYYQKLSEPLPKHLAQLNLYQTALGIDEGVILYGNKNDQDMKEFMTKRLDFIVTRQNIKMEQTERALDQGYLPERIGEKSCGDCKWCDWKTYCHDTPHTFTEADHRNKEATKA